MWGRRCAERCLENARRHVAEGSESEGRRGVKPRRGADARCVPSVPGRYCRLKAPRGLWSTLPSGHSLRSSAHASLINHSRFSGGEPCNGPGRQPTTGPPERASADGKVYPTVDVSHLLKITSALLKACLGSGRYHRCRKPSTHVSLRHMLLERQQPVVQNRAMDWLDRSGRPPVWTPTRRPALPTSAPPRLNSRPVHSRPAAISAELCRHDSHRE